MFTLLHLLTAPLLLLLVQLVFGECLDIEIPLTLRPLSYSGRFGLVGGDLELHEGAQSAHQPVFDECSQDHLQLASLWVYLLSQLDGKDQHDFLEFEEDDLDTLDVDKMG